MAIMSMSADYGLSAIVATSPSYPAITVCPLSNPPTHPSMNHYIQRLSEASAHATLDDPLNNIFQREKQDWLPPNHTQSDMLAAMTAANLRRLQDKAKQPTSAAELIARDPSTSIKNAFIIECASFAAVACWTPPSLTSTVAAGDLHNIVAARDRPSFAHFLTGIEEARERHLYSVAPKRRLLERGVNGDPKYGFAFWYLSLMARDPRRKDKVKGAVRGTLQPVVEQANRDGVPLWLEAGSSRARDVYSYFGFVVVEEVVVQNVPTWCMLKLPQQMRGDY